MDNISIIRRLRSPTKEFRGLHEGAAEVIEKLEQQLARQRQQLEDYALSNIQDRQELAAAQAREKVLRDALEDTINNLRCTESWAWEPLVELFHLPADNAALKAALAAERERCAEAVDDFVNEHTYLRVGNVIRALGD